MHARGALGGLAQIKYDERFADCDQLGSLSEGMESLKFSPNVLSSREFKLYIRAAPKSVAKDGLTFDGDAARNKTHAQLRRKVRANEVRMARGEANAGAAKAPGAAEGEEAAAACAEEAATIKENHTCAHVEHGACFYSWWPCAARERCSWGKA